MDKPKPSLLDRVVRIVVGCGLGALGALLLSDWLAAQNDPRASVLANVVVRQPSNVVQLCPLHPIHHCDVQVGSISGIDLTWQQEAIAAPANCDAQLSEAYAACQTDTVCLARRGILVMERAARGDARTRTLQTGQIRIQCDEGHLDGQFAASIL